MKKRKCLAFILAWTLILSIMNLLVVQRVSATPGEPIILPFDTSWEVDQPKGWVNSWDWNLIKDFSSPELGPVYKKVETPEPNEVYGFDFEDYQLRAAGTFGSSYSYCYFNLFDTTPECDARPPFKIRQHTFISIFYYHDQLAHCMIDAQLYNSRTHQYWSLSKFYVCEHDGFSICKYIVDQNDVRIHPGYRYNDPVGSWQFASFDLSIVYEDDPNWYVTKILIGFGNTIDPNHPTGPARTYFDLLAITYGVGQKIHFEDEGNPDDNAWISATIEAWDYFHPREGKYDLRLKVGVAGFDDGYVDYSSGIRCSIFPYLMKVSTNASDPMVVTKPEPTGVNLTREEQDPNLPPGKAADFVLGAATLIASYCCPPLEATLTVMSLATSFFGLLTPAPAQPLYEWPEADWGDKMGFPYVPIGNWDPKKFIAGEVYIQIPGLARGTHSFEFTFTVVYVIEDPSGPWEFAIPLYYRSCELTLNFEWSTTPDDVNLPPDTPSTPSGPTTGCTGTTYPYSTSTRDPNDDQVQYEFDWGDDSPNTLTGWYDSGENATASHQWTSPGTYNIKVRAQDYSGYLNGYWGLSSPILTVNIEPSLVTILNTLGFTNIQESTVETFVPGTYTVKLYAEFAGYHAQNNLSWYPVGTTQYNLIFSGPEGNYGYGNPPIVKTFTINSQFGLSFLSPEARYFTETSKNPDGIKHAMVCRIFGNPNMYLIGFENKLGGGDKDYNDMVISLERPPYTPSAPSGPTAIYNHPTYTYYASTTDPDNDSVQYEFDWGDGSTNMTGWYASGATASSSHSWSIKGTYNVRVRAQDSYGAWSDWSPYLTIVEVRAPWGDVNNDSHVSAADLGKLKLILSGYIPQPYYPPYIPDINGDGIVSGADVGTLKLIISGYPP